MRKKENRLQNQTNSEFTGKRVWITGASTGIGAETALNLAQGGAHVFVTARSEDKLKALAEKAKKQKYIIYAYPGDVTDAPAMQKIVEDIETDHGPIDIALFNAGAYKADPPEEFTFELFKQHFNVNVLGTGACLDPILKKFLARQSGHIAFVASVAGYRGLPRALSYGPTKAALINLAESLRMQVEDQGIKVQVINPGFVKTPLTDKNDFEMPMIMELEAAAEALVKGLSSDKFEITFPRLFCTLIKWIGLLPDKAYFWILKKITKGERS